MQDMLGRIHEVVGGLMPAENFYIVLYDDIRETLRFLYFADQRDPYVADPDVELDVDDLGTSLTVALLRHGQPLFGPSERSEEHTSEFQSLMRISYAVFCLKKKKRNNKPSIEYIRPIAAK